MNRILLVAATFIFALGSNFCKPVGAAAQDVAISPYELRVIRQLGVTVLQFTTNQGKMNAYLPERIREGEPFSGTLECMCFVSSGTVLDYKLTFGGQSARVRDGAFHWKVPENSVGYMRLRLVNNRDEELAVTEVPVFRTTDPRQVPLPDGEQLHLPSLIQAGVPAPVFGPMDGDSRTTNVEIEGTKLQVLAEVPGEAIVETPGELRGLHSYLVRKENLEGRGQTRVIHIEQTLSPTHRNGDVAKWNLRIRGLAGIQEIVPLKFEIMMPQTGDFEPNPPYSYFPSREQYLFIMPKNVPKDGSFRAERNIIRIVDGPLGVFATLLVPQNLHDAVETILRTPREDYSKDPWKEHAEALKPYGESILPVLAEMLTTEEDLSREALNVLSMRPDHGAKWIIPRLSQMPDPPLDNAVRWWTDESLKDPKFGYRTDLYSTVVELVTQRKSQQAILALGKIGSTADIPLLEKVFNDAHDETNGRDSIVRASEAALARLGVQRHIEQLAKEVAIPGTFWGDDIQRAIYSDRPEMIPALCRHIHDPGAWFGDYGTDPGGDAKAAILAIEHKPLTDDQVEKLCKLPLP